MKKMAVIEEILDKMQASRFPLQKVKKSFKGIDGRINNTEVLSFVQDSRVMHPVAYRFRRRRGRRFVARIEEYLNPDDKVLDLGAGSCIISQLLGEKVSQVVPLDVANLSMVEGITPVIYDGARIPFAKKEFDVCLLSCVLHHTEEPLKTLSEAARVAERVIVIEDIYHNGLHKYLTYGVDSLLNMEFFGHPHNNLSDDGWRKVFSGLNLSVRDARYCRSYKLFQHGIYYLESV